jgi:Fic family protein
VKPFTPDPLPRRDLDWAALVPRIGRAHSALGRYDEIVRVLVNPQILLAPLAAREAVLSSRIEGTQAGLQDLFAYEAEASEASGSLAQDVVEVVNYRRAMEESVAELARRPLSLNLLKRAHAVLLDSVRGRDKGRGEFRRDEVFIAPPGTPIDRATYVPPAWTELERLLDNFEKYLHADEPDAIVQAGIAHAQFELIHPFYDGNGRLGRMLVPLHLFSRNVISSPSFYISSYLEANRDEYYVRLAGLSSSGEWQGWVEFFLDAVAAQAEADTRRVRQILALYDRLKALLADRLRTQFALRALDPLFMAPWFSTPQYVQASGMPRASVARVLGELVASGVLTLVREGRGRRVSIYAFPELMAIVSTETSGSGSSSPLAPLLTVSETIS